MSNFVKILYNLVRGVGGKGARMVYELGRLEGQLGQLFLYANTPMAVSCLQCQRGLQSSYETQTFMSRLTASQLTCTGSWL